MSHSPISTPGRQPRGLRLWLLRLAALSVTLVLCLLAMEAGVRIALPFFNPQAQIPFRFYTNGVALGMPNQTVHQSTPKGDYNLLIHFNQDGFRDSKTLQQSTETDWFALGDSYTLGWGVQENERFSSRLEELFRSNGIPGRVFNIAVPENIVGYQHLLAYAESRGARVRRLVIGLCMENDLCDYSQPKTASEAERASLGSPSLKERIRSLLKDHSALYVAASYSLQKTAFTRRLLEKAGIARDIQELVGYNTWNETVLHTSRDQLLKLVAGRQAVVLIVPSRNLWVGPHQAEERRVHEAWLALLREAGVPVVDPSQALEAQGNPLAYYFKTDPHWNPRGHEIAARELLKWFKSQDNAARVLPPPSS